MEARDVPKWILSLDDEDIEFIKNFFLRSGSLKQIAEDYKVSYPTVRIRLDRIIQKVELSRDLEKEPLISYVKQLAIEDRIAVDDAKSIIEKYKRGRNDD